MMLKKKLKTLVAFHTRNAPHKGHEWIHQYGLSKCDNLLIQPLVGQFKKGEFKEEVIIKTNKTLIKENFKKVMFILHYSILIQDMEDQEKLYYTL